MEEKMDHDNQKRLPFDEQAMRNAEQFALDLETPKPQPPSPDYPKPCGNLGYCYCPRCNPK